MLFKVIVPVLCILCLLSTHTYAGVETQLYHHKDKNDCTINISHSATPSSTNGTIIIRSHNKTNGVFESCSPSQESLTKSLHKAMKIYSKTSLKPITSVSIGSIAKYDWIALFLQEFFDKQDTRTNWASHKKFNSLIEKPSVTRPFKNGMMHSGFDITKASCEKIMMGDDQKPADAMCWFTIKKQTRPTQSSRHYFYQND